MPPADDCSKISVKDAARRSETRTTHTIFALYVAFTYLVIGRMNKCFYVGTVLSDLTGKPANTRSNHYEAYEKAVCLISKATLRAGPS
mmetsp:Transcript_38685/g.93708  ORF Transcript_38685/g.93708 Transcript_38685/m.93708 type:complete len:88 (-) Transcript_38685:7-270(-)